MTRPGLTDRTDRYAVESELSRGAVGIVYRARDRERNREVALKVLDLDREPTETDLRRFRREIAVASAVDHPGLVEVHDWGLFEGAPFYAMELVPGPTLHAETIGRRLEPRRALEIVRDVARAIHEVHERGVVHRDLKPGNILLDPERGPRLVDFGLAKNLRDRNALTADHDVLGTPWYMAPEQFASAAAVDRRADVYSLGVILYELLTGVRPFPGQSAVEVVRAIVGGDPPSLREHAPGLPREVRTVCLVAMHRDPAWRYASAEALARDLGRVLEGRSPEASLPRPLDRAARWIEDRPLVAGGLIVGTALVLVILGYVVLA